MSKKYSILKTGLTVLLATLMVGAVVNATTTVGDNVSVGGTLAVTGASTLTGALAANGGITVDTSNFTVSGTTGAVSTASTLAVTGATTLSSTLGVTGATTLTGGLIVPTQTSVAINGTSTLTVGTGATVLGGTLAVTGASTLTGGATIGTSTTGVALSGTFTTGITIPNTATTGINFAGGAANQPIKIGALSSTVPGTAVIVNDSNPRVVDVHAEDNDVASADTAITLSTGRFRLVRYANSVAEDYSLHGLVKYTDGVTKSRWGAGVMGAAEATGTTVLSNLTAGVLGRFGTSGELTLTGAGDRIAAVAAFNNNGTALAGSGKSVGVLVMETDVGTPVDLNYGLEIRDSVATTGIQVGTAPTGLNFSGAYTTTAIQLGTAASKMTLAAYDDHVIDVNVTSGSTDGSNSVRPIHMINTMTGAGGVGGRAEFEMNTEVVLGGWANAIKGYTDFGTAGSVTGLGSAIVAEMRMPAKTLTGGNYAPFEAELVFQASGTTGGTPVSFLHAQASGDATSLQDFRDTGYVMSLQGLGDATTQDIFQANNNTATHALKILIGSTPYYILLSNTSD